MKRLNRFFDIFKREVKELFDDDPVTVMPFRSYANENSAIISGRVLEDEGIEVREDETLIENFLDRIRLFKSDEIAHERLQLHLRNDTHSTKTDREGYFKLTVDYKNEFKEQIHFDSANLLLENQPLTDDKVFHKNVEIMNISSNSQYGIITDIDDTILQSHVDSRGKVKLLYETFFKNHYGRKPFEKISDVLQDISSDSAGNYVHPVFYLSNSPWNLYFMLRKFMDHNALPTGPFFLRDFGLKYGKEKRLFKEHKINTIRHLFQFYQDLDFILIGDATQEDADIYLKAYEEYGERIKYIFIRHTKKVHSNERILSLIEKNVDVPLYLITHSEDILKIIEREGK